VRFSQTSELKPAEKARVQQVVIRRLKRDINERMNPPKFCSGRPPLARLLQRSPKEAALSHAFEEFRAVRRLIVLERASPARGPLRRSATDDGAV
jgi:hypothetical protein